MKEKKEAKNVNEEKEYLINFYLMDFIDEHSTSGLPPREVREKDIDYQRHRVNLFRKLLERLPSSTREVSFLFSRKITFIYMHK